MKVKSVSCAVVSDSLQPHQAPLSMDFSRQEYWSGLSFPPPGDIPDSGVESGPPRTAHRFFTTEPQGSLQVPDYCVALARSLLSLVSAQ